MCFIDLNKTAPPLMSVLEKAWKSLTMMLPRDLQKYLTSAWFISAYLEKKVELWDLLWLCWPLYGLNNCVLKFFYLVEVTWLHVWKWQLNIFGMLAMPEEPWVILITWSSDVQQLWSKYEIGVDLCFVIWYFVDCGYFYIALLFFFKFVSESNLMIFLSGEI